MNILSHIYLKINYIATYKILDGRAAQLDNYLNFNAYHNHRICRKSHS